MCDASSKEKAIGGKINDFSDQLVSQAGEVFGNDSTVFNNMLKAYSGIVAGGPSQHGFSGGERSAMDAAAITNNANQFRNVAGAVKAGQAAYGGGNTVTQSGTTVGQNEEVAQAAAANTANSLNQIDQADWSTGRDNFWRASQGEQQLPGVFDNMPGIDNAASKGLDSSLQEQKSLDAASGWWKKPVMGLVGAGLSAATGGLGSMAAGGTFLGGVGKSLGSVAPKTSSASTSNTAEENGQFA